VALESEPGSGTTVSIFLPRLARAMAVEEAPASGSAPLPTDSPTTLLVVEDDSDVRQLLEDVLTFKGHRVVTANNGREALARYASQRRDIGLVLTDQMMPEMGGVDLARALGAGPSPPSVVVLTGYPMADRADELPEGAVFSWLEKPIDIDELDAVIVRALGRSERAA